MKKPLILALILSIPCGHALAGEPCPSDVKDEKPADPDEKCKPDLSGFATVIFDFPDDKKDAPAAEDKDAADDHAAAPSEPVKAGADDHAAAPSEPANGRALPKTCTYSAYAWDTKKNRTTDHFKVSKPYEEVTDDERDPNVAECTICCEDQVTISPRDIGIDHAPIRICHVYADQVREALAEIAASGEFDIEKLEGYRPGRTRGAIDKNGLRTQWSQHSYGTAIDINANRNAIYSNCPGKLTNKAAEVKSCKRGIGGAWQPEKAPRVSIVKDGVVYKAMTKFWKWGGEIGGATKDIMHFSVTGY